MSSDSLTSEEIMVANFRAYVSPILFVIGIPSNTLVIIVFIILERQSPCRFNMYAIWSSVVHNVQLISNTFMDDFLGRGLQWATNGTFWIQLDTQSSFSCKTITYLTDSSALTAALILMLFSVDRVCCVYFPAKFEHNDQYGLVRIGIPAVYLIGMVLPFPNFVYADIKVSSSNTVGCEYIDPVAPGVQYLLYLYIVGVNVLPAALIFVTNALILAKLQAAIKRSKQEGRSNEAARTELSRVIVHLLISLMFTCLSFPLIVVIILRQQVYLFNYDKTDPDYAMRIIQLSKLFSSIDSMNHTFDGIIFFIFMPIFRYITICLMTCKFKQLWKRQSNNQPNVNSMPDDDDDHHQRNSTTMETIETNDSSITSMNYDTFEHLNDPKPNGTVLRFKTPVKSGGISDSTMGPIHYYYSVKDEITRF